MAEPSRGQREGRLLKAVAALGAEPGLLQLLETIRVGVADLPGCTWAGLGIQDERRGVTVVYPAYRGAGSGPSVALEGEEIPSPHRSGSAGEIRTVMSMDLSQVRTTPLDERLAGLGVRRYVSVPLVCHEDVIGSLYAGFGAAVNPPPGLVAYLEEFGRILTPAFWNHRTHTRLAKGDRRRATLIELSRAINTSLKFDEVLAAARHAALGLEGHRLSIIALLQEGGDGVDLYKQGQVDDGRVDLPREPEVESAAGGVMAWMREQERTYESDDLQTRARFPTDARLRAAGVRRYVASPMFVRGRIIGAFLFGTADPHPALTTDVWLYENIALQLGLALENARQYERLEKLSDRLAQQNVYLREEIQSQHNFEEMVGRSPAMHSVFEAISRVAKTDATVLILGETGVGKELVARGIHARSDRADQPLVKINCAAIPETLVESELFGHERGAFTSATARRQGRFELAEGGTLFLDEVGELPLAVQAKLLRVLQDGEFERVGGTVTLKTNVRIIAATNRDLERSVSEGSFRSDLYYRLNVFPIRVPPLAHRREDIPLLIERFIAQHNRRMGRGVQGIDAESMRHLCERPWPGNIRELQHVIERAMILCDGPLLRVDRSDMPAVTGPSMRPPVHGYGAPPAYQPMEQSRPPASPNPGPELAPPSSGGTLQDMERRHIEATLRQTYGIIDGPNGAAKLLGLKPSTLRFRMKKLGVSRRQ